MSEPITVDFTLADGRSIRAHLPWPQVLVLTGPPAKSNEELDEAAIRFLASMVDNLLAGVRPHLMKGRTIVTGRDQYGPSELVEYPAMLDPDPALAAVRTKIIDKLAPILLPVILRSLAGTASRQ